MFFKKLCDVFERLDVDNSGGLSSLELAKLSTEDLSYLRDELHVSHPDEIFEAIDVDGNGILDLNEFLETIWGVATFKEPIEFQRIQFGLRMIRLENDQIQQELSENMAKIYALLSDNLSAKVATCQDASSEPVDLDPSKKRADASRRVTQTNVA